MSKLIKKVEWKFDGSNTEMYMYGEADFEANKAMQEPLEKLFQYENQPDMREKIREYIGELDTEIKRVQQSMEIEDNKGYNISLAIVQTLQKVKDDLLKRMHEWKGRVGMEKEMERKRNNPAWCCDQIEEKIKDYKLSLTEIDDDEVRIQLEIVIDDLETILYGIRMK